MKRCPDCRRDYYDDSLLYCLDDGSALLDGPGSLDEPPTAILTDVLAPQPRSTDDSQPSIAVLPFAHLSSDPDDEYFCDGLAEELLNALARIDGLKVAARTSSFSYKGKDAKVDEIGKALGVKNVLEGSVRKSGNRLRITAQLINTDDGYHVWSDRFDLEMLDIFDIQDEITLAVVSALKLKLFGAAKSAVLKKATTNAEAHELYLKGRYNWSKMEGVALKKAVDYYKRALEIDADYALAYAGLSDAYVLLVNHAGAPLKETIPMAIAAAEKAIELDPDLADGYTSLGMVKTFYDWDWPGGELALRRAVELNPRSSHARHILAIRLCFGGLIDEASEHFRVAHELDPLSPSINEHLAWPHYYSGDYDRAIAQLEKTIEMEPGFKNVHFRLGLAYLHKGMYERAVAKIEDALNISSDRDAVAWLGYVYALMGREAEARAVLAELQTIAAESYVPSYDFAIVHLGLGERDEAFHWLERGAKEHDYWMALVLIDPELDALRDDPRFDELIRLVGIPHPGNNAAGQV